MKKDLKERLKIGSIILCISLLLVFSVPFINSLKNVKSKQGLIVTPIETWKSYPNLNYKGIVWKNVYTEGIIGYEGNPKQPCIATSSPAGSSSNSMSISLSSRYCDSISGGGSLQQALISERFNWSKYDEVFIGYKFDVSLSTTAQFSPVSGSAGVEFGDKKMGLGSGSCGSGGNIGSCTPYGGGSVSIEGTLLFSRNLNGGWDIYDVGRYIKTYLVTVEGTLSEEPLGFFSSLGWTLSGSYTSAGSTNLIILNIWGTERKEQCSVGSVKLQDGSCYPVVQTCIDNNKNSICDQDDPIIWADANNPNIPICADRNGDGICDNVESLFCEDNNNNQLCDSDELKWSLTHCEDSNSNNICDGVENEKSVLCSNNYDPLCDLGTNITYPNKCIADSFNVNYIIGKCTVEPTIIRLDCATGDVPIPTGYSCDSETGWLFRIQDIYKNVETDCRSYKGVNLTQFTEDEYVCREIYGKWVLTKEYVVEQKITCPALPCPQEGDLCQNGVCVRETDITRCENDYYCKQKFGEKSVCNLEVGLCVADRYKELTCADTEINCLEDETCELNTEKTRGRCVRTETLNCPDDMFYDTKNKACVFVDLTTSCLKSGCPENFDCVILNNIYVCKGQEIIKDCRTKEIQCPKGYGCIEINNNYVCKGFGFWRSLWDWIKNLFT